MKSLRPKETKILTLINKREVQPTSTCSPRRTRCRIWQRVNRILKRASCLRHSWSTTISWAKWITTAFPTRWPCWATTIVKTRYNRQWASTQSTAVQVTQAQPTKFSPKPKLQMQKERTMNKPNYSSSSTSRIPSSSNDAPRFPTRWIQFRTSPSLQIPPLVKPPILYKESTEFCRPKGRDLTSKCHKVLMSASSSKHCLRTSQGPRSSLPPRAFTSQCTRPPLKWRTTAPTMNCPWPKSQAEILTSL